MKAETKTKISLYGWPAAYFVLGIALAFSVAAAAFKTSFVRIYVSGQSMEPTLHGGSSGGAKEGDTVDFGYMDPSEQAINNLKRFNIVTTYFPYGWNSSDYDAQGNLRSTASYKIKRVIGFPNETVTLAIDKNNTCKIRITSGNAVNEYVYSDTNKSWTGLDNHNYCYEITHSGVNSTTPHKNYSTTLGVDEYFVMGDNWNVSSDSSINYLSSHKHLKKNNLQGVLIAIEGKATVTINKTTGKGDLTNLVYGEKKYYYTEL